MEQRKRRLVRLCLLACLLPALASAQTFVHVSVTTGNDETGDGSQLNPYASILAGQWMPYLEQALADQVSGARNMLDKKMKEKTDQLSDEDAEAIIHFYGSQQ